VCILKPELAGKGEVANGGRQHWPGRMLMGVWKADQLTVHLYETLLMA
jgi:hypothetical protein